MWRIAVVIGLAGFGCINQLTSSASRAVNPPPEGGGTLTCKEIVETCDKECTHLMCLHACTNNGTTEAAAQHDALLSCGQNAGCLDEDCMRANCSPQIETCMGPEALAPSSDADPPVPAAEGTPAPSEPTPETTDAPVTSPSP